MTADSPASGLPQEAVDAAWNARDRHVAENGGAGQMEAALTAALPFLRAHIRAELADEMRIPKVSVYAQNHDLREDLAAERAKVAALQQAVDKVRALHRPFQFGTRTLCNECSDDLPEYHPCPTVALLPDVQADDRGTPTPTPATTCAGCGTTRTICDAGLNTYDTRCCEQCGHGVT